MNSILYLILIFLFCFLFWIINFVILVRGYASNSNSQTFECGFECHHYQGFYPSLHFFKLALIFVLFDLELLFLLGLFGSLSWQFHLLLMGFLGGTLLLEYMCNSLNWTL